MTEPCNPVIAKVFRLLGWADRSGSGIEKITTGWTSMGYGKPIFQDDKPVNMFEVIFRLAKEKLKGIPEVIPENIPERVTEKQKKILQMMAANPHVSMQEIAQIVGIAQRNIKVHIKKLKNIGRLKRIGPDKGGHWEVREYEKIDKTYS